MSDGNETKPAAENDDCKFLAPKLPKKKPTVVPNSAGSSAKPSAAQQQTVVVNDDYSPPSWAEVPPDLDHTIEVMNNGVIVRQHKLSELAAKKSYITVGRADICDIQTNIPGSSRLHCYIQYGEAFDGRGWYVYDNKSTHGTFVNKQEMPKNVYYKARFGSVIQITKSNFHLFLNGTDESKKDLRGPAGAPQSNNEDSSAKKHESFEKDPMAALSKYCEREGLEFKFSKLSTEEKDKGVTYAFDLPGESTDAQSFSGSGADAQIAQRNCALQVCRHLNGLGALEGEIDWGTRRNLEDNDFYDEDEDTFYDRTGQLEAQRLKRIQRHNANVGIKEKAMTYDEVSIKVTQLEAQKQAIVNQLERLMKPPAGAKILPGEIDLSALGTSISIKMEVSKLKRKYEDLNKEVEVLREAAEAIKPIVLKFPTPNSTGATTAENFPSSNPPAQSQLNNRVAEEKKPIADDHPASSNKPKEHCESPPSTSSGQSNAKAGPPSTAEEKKVEAEKEETTKESSDIKGPSMPPPPVQKPQKPSEPRKFGLLTREDLRANKNAALNKRKIAEEFQEDELSGIDEKRNRTEQFEDEQEPEWVPPAGQSGDGRTKLNEKFAGRY